MKASILLSIMPLALLLGCQGPHKQHAGEHGHEAGAHVHDAKLYLTHYGSSMEFFTEADPLYNGGNSHFLIQLSRLDNFKPLDSAHIEMNLETGGKSIAATGLEQVGKGQYKLELQAAGTGEGNLHFRIRGPQNGQGFQEEFRIPVQIYDNEHNAHHAAEHHIPSGSNTVAFPKAQSYLIDFKTEEARMETLGSLIPTVARIEAVPTAQNEIIAKASGIVSFENKNVVEGLPVEEGEALFSIESGGLLENNINQYISEVASDYGKARKDYERKKALAEDKIVSESELLEAKTTYEKALVNYQQVQDNFAGDRQIVRAPVSGYVKQVNVQNGQYVEAGQALLSVSQNQKLLLKAELPPRQYPLLKHLTEVNIREMNASRTYSLQEVHGNLVSVGQSTSPESPLVPVTFEIDNVFDAIPGGFVNLYLKTSGQTPRLSVPNTALVEEMGNYFVFVQLTPELFEKRSVTIGANDGFRTEIKEGLEDGERIVSKGAQIIKLSQGTGTLDPHAGHAH